MNWTWTKFKSQAAKNKFELEQILGLFLKKKKRKKKHQDLYVHRIFNTKLKRNIILN